MSTLFESLESRSMMSGNHHPTTFDLSDEGVLTISGSAGADHIVVALKGNPATQRSAVKITSGEGKHESITEFSGVKSVTVKGGDGDDSLIMQGSNLSGFWSDNQIFGGNGDDRIQIRRFDGAISAHGGNGNDTLDASKAIGEVSRGANHNRRLYGGNGHDFIVGSSADDDLFGGYGRDTVWAGAGNDTVFGGPGRNYLYGSTGNDSFHSRPITGWSVNKTEWTLGGHDFIDGGTGYDRVYKQYNPKWESVFRISTIRVEGTIQQPSAESKNLVH